MSSLINGCTIGSDPELFLTNGKHCISAIDKFPGDKKNPVEWKDGVMVQVDNCSVEYNTPVTTSKDQWVRAHSSAYRQISEFAAEKFGLKLAIIPSTVFPEEELQDPRAWIMGCEPDYNAWLKQWNPKPHCAIEEMRSCGGHVHIGLPKFTEYEVIELVKLVDMHIGVPGLIVDTDDRRRLLYGKAGAMRFKPYGVEWRTGSNFWIQTEERVAWVYEQVNKALIALESGFRAPDIVREIIDTGNRLEAAKFCQTYNMEVPK